MWGYFYTANNNNSQVVEWNASMLTDVPGVRSTLAIGLLI